MERTLSQLALWLQDRLLIAYIVNVESLVAHVRTIAGDMPAKAIIDEAKARKWLAGPLQSYGANLRGEGEFSQPFYRILPAVADSVVPGDVAPSYTKAWFRANTKLSASHISNMMKGAKVKRAPRGGKNYEWSESEVRKTLKYIIDHSQDEEVVAASENALRKITM